MVETLCGFDPRPTRWHAKCSCTNMLNPTQIAALRKQLLAERARLLPAEPRLAAVRSPAERAADPADEAGANLAQHEALAHAAHDRPLLAEIEHALAKMDAGTYGLSEFSGEPIELARLNVVPWARFTAQEQQDLELARR
jgi:DnaK suppressor protein